MKKNVFYSLLGQIVPLAAAVFAIPKLVESLGTTRFGLLSLAWMLIGYFSIFDLGLGKAVAKSLAERLAKMQLGEASAVIGTAVWSTFGLGVVGGGFLFFAADFLAKSVLKIEASTQGEAVVVFQIIAIAIPITLVSSALRGVLEVYQKFSVLSMIQALVGLSNYIIPILILRAERPLSEIMLVLILLRLLALIGYGYFVFHQTSFSAFRYTKGHLSELISFGGWITLTNVMAPLITYADRFLITSALSLSALAYYTTPYEILMKLWIVPGALLSVLFPVFAGERLANPHRAQNLYFRGSFFLIASLTLLGTGLITLSQLGLGLWINAEFAKESYKVFQWLMIAFYVNCLGFLPAGYLQASGRPDLPAKTLVGEFLPYVALLWILVSQYGIVGAAWAWLIRNAVDTLTLQFLLARETGSFREFIKLLSLSMLGFALQVAALILSA